MIIHWSFINGRIFLLVTPLAYFAHGIVFIASGVFNGSGHPIPAVVVSIIRMFGLFIPLAYFLNIFFGIYGIFASYTVATLTMGSVACVWSYKYIKKKDQNVSIPA